MTAVRLLLVLTGASAIWYGADLLWQFDTTDLAAVARWFLGGILIHDALFAPACAALGLAGRRVLPRARWAPAACGAACTVTVLLVAVPVLGREHGVADNPTVLDRPYAWGLAAALALIWALVALDLLLRRRITDGVRTRIRR